MAEARKAHARRSKADDAEEEEVHLAEEEGGSGVATTVIAGIAVAVFAPELLPGMAIGVGAMLAPKILPALGPILRPVVKTVVQGGYVAITKTREMAAEAGEQVQDIWAETQAEKHAATRKSA